MSGEKPFLDLGVFKDKVCIIGLTAEGTTDLHPNPFEPLFPALGIHADIFNSILTNNFITRASPGINLIILLVLFLCIAGTALKTKPMKGFCLLLLAISLFVFFSVILFTAFGLWIDVVYPSAMMGVVYLLCLLFKYVKEWKKRLIVENELKIARKIQQSFLPKSIPSNRKVDIAANMYTAWQVGGDLYDFLEFSDDKLGVMIGDVSGKGIPASLFMSMAVGAFKFFASAKAKPEETLLNLNEKLNREAPSGLFVTVFYSIFDTNKKTMTYANGGHFPLLYLPKDKPPEFLDVEEGVPLGMMESAYSGNQIPLTPGDIFIFYTDGVIEATNAKSQMYGEDRLCAMVEKNRDLSSKDLLDKIEKDVRRFEPVHTQHDDITLIVIKIL